MKKVGILTYHSVANFGAQLQTLSTIGYFRKHGYEPVVINWFPYDLESFYKREVPACQYEIQYNFAQTQMPVSRLCRTVKDVADEITRLEIRNIFIGSDALFDYTPIRNRLSLDWKHLKLRHLHAGATHDLPNAFWGSFNDYLDTKPTCVGFSISSQNTPYGRLNQREIKEMKRLLQNFSYLSLRDTWTKKMVEHIGRYSNLEVTPDPVFSFNQNATQIIEKNALLKKYNLPDRYILVSFCQKVLSEQYVNSLINSIEQNTGCQCVAFPMPRRLLKFNMEKFISLPLPTLDWYYLIKYSQGYVGELMHPIICCLHNSIPFFCYDQYGVTTTVIPFIWHNVNIASSKIYDILEKADFLSNMCSYSSFNEEETTIDFVVNQFLAFDKIKCKKFANSAYDKYKQSMKKIESLLTD